MTPTLWGRWQTRLFLLGTIGFALTCLFAFLFNSLIPFVLLVWVLILGFVWDVIYDVVQRQRWDHDWPPTLQLSAGIVEGFFICILIYGLGWISPAPTFTQFWLHYGTVWVATFLASQSLMRLLFPRWRYRGGQWLF